MFWTSSKSLAFSSAIATCAVKALRRDSSSAVNGPPLLFSTWVTPMILPCLLMSGTHRIERVKKPGLLVERRVEAQVGIGVGNVDRLARGEHGARDAGVVGEADFADLRTHGDAGEQLAWSSRH